jgi:exodeoxyribonuclease-3
VRIATWNVNSIGARLPRLLDWLATREPDVAALQETKCGDATFPRAEIEAAGYEVLHVGDGRWNGVAILSRVGLTPLATSLPAMTEPRYAVAECAGLRVTSVYVPNGRAVDDPQYAYKLEWFAALQAAVAEVPAGTPQVVMGDFNVARTDADVWDPALFRHSTHVTPAERSAMDALVAAGLTDVVARPGKNDRPYTYWDYRAGRFHQDQGMRIDYVLASGSVRVDDAYVDREARKGKLPSDHAPVVVDCTLAG